jgi:hypothetical protein
MRDGPETKSEMARRHVRDSQDRVWRQVAIVAELVKDNHSDAAARGRELLETMRSTLDLAKDHLREIERRNYDIR